MEHIILFRFHFTNIRLYLTNQIKCFCLPKNVGYSDELGYARCFLSCKWNKRFSFLSKKEQLSCADYNDLFYFIDQFCYRNETIYLDLRVVRINILNIFIMWWPLTVVIVALMGLQHNVIITLSFYNSVF